MDALAKIASAALIDETPIYGLVFQRNTLVSNQENCKIVCQFAEGYSDKLVSVINMIYNDQDSEAKNHAVSAYYCKIEDWKMVEVIFDNNLK